MSAEDLIASLQGGLRVDSEGSFTLHREKAREKLRTFQVAEPQKYVLNLMALAALKGATAVHVRCDSDDVVVSFDGAPVTAADLDDLYGSSFAAASTDVQRARQQLALAIHAALALNPRFVRVVSGSGETAVSMVARHGAPDEIGAATATTGGTEVHVKQRFRPGLLVRFVQNLRGSLAEMTWLRERCRFSPRPIHLNGEAIHAGMVIPGAKHAFTHSLGASRGVAGLVDGDRAAVVRLVRHGVWLHDVEVPALPWGFVAVIADDQLLTDLSGDKVVQDEHHARCMALARLLAGAVIHSAIGPAEVELAPELARRLGPVWHYADEVLAAESTIGAALGRVIRFPDVFGRRHSLGRLRRIAADSGHVPVTRVDFSGRLPETETVVLRLAPDHHHEDTLILQRLFGERLRDASDELERAAQIEQSRRRWRAQPSEPKLTAANYHLTAPFEVNLGGVKVVGEIGLRRAPTTTCSLRVVVDGCLLTELELAGPIAGIDAVIGGPLPLLLDYTGPVRGELLAACLGGWLASARTLAEMAVARGLVPTREDARDAFVHGYLRSMQRSEALRSLLTLAGFDEEASTTRMRHLLRTLPPQAPARDLHEQGWLRAAYRIPTARGETLDVGAVGMLLQQDVKVTWVPEARPGHPRIEAPVLRLGARELEAVRWLFGGRVARLRDEDYQLLLAKAKFFDRPAATGVLSEETCSPHVTVEHAGLRIGAAFVREGKTWVDQGRRATCELVVHGRRIGEANISTPVPGVQFAFVGEALTIKPTWDGVIQDDAFRAAARAALGALPGLVRAAVAAVRVEPEGPMRTLWERGITAALTATFPTGGLRWACALLVAAYGVEDGQARYMRLLAFQYAALVRELDGLMREPGIDAKTLGDPQKVARKLGVAPPDEATVTVMTEVLAAVRAALGQVGGSTWLEDVGRSAPEVAGLSLLHRVDGTTVTLGQFARQVEGGGVFLVIDPEDAAWPNERRRRLLADEWTRALLRTLYDESRLRIPASAEDAASVTSADDLLRLLTELHAHMHAPRGAVEAVPRLIAGAIAGCQGDGPEAAIWKKAVRLALGATFPAPLLRVKYRALCAALGPEAAELAYCKLLQRAQEKGMEWVLGSLTGMAGQRLLDEVEGPANEATHTLRALLAALRAALGQVGGPSLLESVVRFSADVAGLPLFERIDGSPVMVGTIAEQADRRELFVFPDAAPHERPRAYAGSLRVDRPTHNLIMGLFGSEKVTTRAPTAAAPEPDAPAPPRMPTLEAMRTAPTNQDEPTPEYLTLLKLAELRGVETEKPAPIEEIEGDDILEVFKDLRRASGPSPKAGPVKPKEPPKPPQPTPADRLVAAIQSELHALRRGHESLLTGFNLDHVKAARRRGTQAVHCGRDGVVLDTAHPQIAAAIAGFASDRMWVSFLVSQVYTALNVWREDITDAHEEAFHARHLAWLRGELNTHA